MRGDHGRQRGGGALRRACVERRRSGWSWRDRRGCERAIPRSRIPEGRPDPASHRHRKGRPRPSRPRRERKREQRLSPRDWWQQAAVGPFSARQVQVERRCICGSSDPSGCASGDTNCTVPPPSTGGVFEYVTRVNSSTDQFVSFTPTTGRTWKVDFRTPNAGESSQNGAVSIRGIRFFNSNATEVFPARVVTN